MGLLGGSVKCKYWDWLDFVDQKRYVPLIHDPKPVIGLDTETAKGKVFLLADSSGFYTSPNKHLDTLKSLTRHSLRSSLNFFYNLKYDLQAVIKGLPEKLLRELYRLNSIEYEGYKIRYIPKKYFSVRKDKHTTAFYDLWQFFHMPLDKAAQRYLNKSKIEIDVSKFNDPEWLKNNYDSVIGYCVNDAVLVKELGEYFQRLCLEGGIDFNKPISPAFVSERYFRQNCWIPKAVPTEYQKIAYENYFGGRFEVFKRGYFDQVYEYDIKSAYPSVIKRLPDFTKGQWYRDMKLTDNPDFGFLKVKVTTNPLIIQPFPYREDNLVIYPQLDKIIRWITLDEWHDFHRWNAGETEILDSLCWYADELIYPFRKIEDLYNYRETFKKENNPIEYVYKIIMNSLYGKFIQTVRKYKHVTECDSFHEYEDLETSKGLETFEVVYKTGQLFNPLYAHIITSEIRRKLWNEAMRNPEWVISTFTDSLTTTEPFVHCSNSLGEFELNMEGEMVMIGTGVYSIRNGDKIKTRFRGFGTSDKFNFFEVLDNNRTKSLIELPQQHVVSLGEMLIHNRLFSPTDLNEFITQNRVLNLNFDMKRDWLSNFENANAVFKQVINSVPLQRVASH